MLGRVYRFMTEQRLFHGGSPLRSPGPSPFSRHLRSLHPVPQGIVRAIRDRGFEVLLAIDEFSWSKRTQPYRIRRRIAAMSVADEFHVHIFPEDFPVNIANPGISGACGGLPGRRVSIVVGSDVVAMPRPIKSPWSRTPSHLRPRDLPPGGWCYGRGLRLHPGPGGGADCRLSWRRSAPPASGGGGRQPGYFPAGGPGGAGLHLSPGPVSAGAPGQAHAANGGPGSLYPSTPAEELLPLLRELAPMALAMARAVSESGDQAVLLHCSGQTCVLGAVTFRCLDSRMLFSRLEAPP